MALQTSAVAALQQRRAHTQACVALDHGKRCLEAGDIEPARGSLLQASAYFRTLTLRLVILGLRMAPRLTSLAARIWRVWGPEAAGWKRERT